MESKLKVTDIPDEVSLYDLVAGDNVLEIPLFQRPYMWKESHYRTMVADAETVIEDPTSAVFLGVIVSYSRGTGPGRPPTWMIVDGQQRITTLYLCVMSAVLVAAQNGELDWAADCMGRYLLVRPMSGLSQNTKLVPSFNDRQQFFDIWEKISGTKNFSSHQMYASNPPRPPAPGGATIGAMEKQFSNITRDLTKLFKEGGLEALNERVEAIATKLSLVTISLREPTVAPKIFERLNYGAEPITVADLVRNEIFARAGSDIQTAQTLFGSKWEPFIHKFKDKNIDFNKFLFPYGLIHNPNIKRNDLFSTIRSIWDKLETPEAIISNLEAFQGPYLSLHYGMPLNGTSSTLHTKVLRLFRMNRPSSVYPFILQLLKFQVEGRIEEDTVLQAIDVIESFLFRRAVAGIEPTGLHAVFKGMWRDLVTEEGGSDPDKNLSAPNIRGYILSKATVAWPTDDEFRHHIMNGPLYRRKISNYAVREYELSLADECPSDVAQLEHIAPQKMTDGWKKKIPIDYDKIIHTWGNLVPISSEMNPGAAHKDFEDKKQYYAKSKFASVRHLAQLHEWNSETIRARSTHIANWAVGRWPY